MPTLLWNGTSRKIEALTMGGAKRVAVLRRELMEANGDEERMIDLSMEMIAVLGYPDEPSSVPVSELEGLLAALTTAQYGATGGGGTGNEPRPTEGVESSPS